MMLELLQRKIYLRRDLVKRLEEIMALYPELSLTTIISLALEEWLRGPELLKSNHDFLIKVDSEIFGPTCKRE